VKDRSSPEWWWCIDSNGVEGYVPATYVVLSPKVWLQSMICANEFMSSIISVMSVSTLACAKS
jgi:hypothetical protein